MERVFDSVTSCNLRECHTDFSAFAYQAIYTISIILFFKFFLCENLMQQE